MNDTADTGSDGSHDLSSLASSGRSLAEYLSRPDGPGTRLDKQRALRSPDVTARVTAMDGPTPGAPGRRTRVCIATSDFLGPVRNGGVGTACAMLAQALADAGHAVTVLYVGPFEGGTPESWRDYYTTKGVTFIVPASPAVRLEGAAHARTSCLVYDWLKHQPAFDIVHFPEINGVGFYSLQAKRLGLAFSTTHFCVTLHSPTLWHRLENREPVSYAEDLTLDLIERQSVAWADSLVSPTHYLLDWSLRWGFTVPAEVYVQPYIVPPSRHRQVTRRTVNEIVFFGRLETRKGLELFCDAIERLERRNALGDVSVTFLGKSGLARTESGERYVTRRTRRMRVPIHIESSLNQLEALAYLRSRNVLAVMPSLADNMPYAVLECLAEGIPFVSCATGGIPEMVASEDHKSALTPPHHVGLADRIHASLREGASSVGSAIDADTVCRQWVAWHERVAGRASGAQHAARKSPQSANASADVEQPLVSVCMATRNRPGKLREALQSLAEQSYPRLEVVLVDDASSEPDAVRCLNELEADFLRRGWQIVRRAENGLPGAARNTAAAHAHGKYLLFMDDDNLARPEEVATFVGAAEFSGIELLTCFMDHFIDRSDGNSPKTHLRWLPLGFAIAPGFVSNEFGDTNMFVRRDTFLRLGGFDEDIDAAFVEDWLFLCRAALAGTQMTVLPESLFWYRVWEHSNSQRDPNVATATRRLYPYLQGESPDRRALLTFTSGLHVRTAVMATAERVRSAHQEHLVRRFAAAAPVLSITEEMHLMITPQQELEVRPIDGGILLRSHGHDPIAWLPKCPPAHAHCIVRIELSAPQDGCLQLFWSTNSTPYPSEDQSVIIPFPAARSVLWAEIPAAAHVGRLRLDPAFSPGDYVLHTLEIRAEGGPHDRQVLWAELQAMYASRSWRWTAALRRIANKVNPRRFPGATTQSPPPHQD